MQSFRDEIPVLTPNPAAGFTMLELMVVLGLMAVLTGLFLLNINTDHHRLRSAAFNLRSDLVRARSEAVKRNVTTEVQFGVDGYLLCIDPDPVLDNPCRAVNTLFEVSVSPKGLVIDNTHYANSKVSFSPRGGALNGYVDLSNAQNEEYRIRTNSAGKIWIEQ